MIFAKDEPLTLTAVFLVVFHVFSLPTHRSDFKTSFLFGNGGKEKVQKEKFETALRVNLKKLV